MDLEMIESMAQDEIPMQDINMQDEFPPQTTPEPEMGAAAAAVYLLFVFPLYSLWNYFLVFSDCFWFMFPGVFLELGYQSFCRYANGLLNLCNYLCKGSCLSLWVSISVKGHRLDWLSQIVLTRTHYPNDLNQSLSQIIIHFHDHSEQTCIQLKACAGQPHHRPVLLQRPPLLSSVKIPPAPQRNRDRQWRIGPARAIGHRTNGGDDHTSNGKENGYECATNEKRNE